MFGKLSRRDASKRACTHPHTCTFHLSSFYLAWHGNVMAQIVKAFDTQPKQNIYQPIKVIIGRRILLRGATTCLWCKQNYAGCGASVDWLRYETTKRWHELNRQCFAKAACHTSRSAPSLPPPPPLILAVSCCARNALQLQITSMCALACVCVSHV